MDVLVVPSIWKETFSLVTLEALSYGVPVIVSDNVGAQDLVREYNPKFIFHTLDELQALLSSLINDKSALKTYNQRILEKPWKHDMLPHAQEIIDKIYRGSQL
jgi:glycosyltransferase involved in cell wall biosynthesis